MVKRIFGSESAGFWKHGLPVIPVEGKAPILKGW